MRGARIVGRPLSPSRAARPGAAIVGVVSTTIVPPVPRRAGQRSARSSGDCGKTGHGSPQPKQALYNQPARRVPRPPRTAEGRWPQPGHVPRPQQHGGLPLHAHNDYSTAPGG